MKEVLTVYEGKCLNFLDPHFQDMKVLKSIDTGKSWVTCARMLPYTHKLAVASFSRSMKIYDLNTYDLCGSIQEIDYAPMAMDSW